MCETENKETREREMRRRLKRVLTEEYLSRADFLKRRIEEIDKDRVPFAYDDCCNVRVCLSRWDELTDAEVDRMTWFANDASLRMSEALNRLQHPIQPKG